VTRYRSHDPVEDGLLDAIRRSPADEHACSVYRDWLEQHGHADRLAFLQDEVIADILVPVDDAPWRAVVSSPPIRNCARACGRRWSQLAATETDQLRRCTTCDQAVVYCTVIQWPQTPFVADASVTSAFDRRPDYPAVPTMNPPPPRQSLPPAVVMPAAKPGALVRLRDWFRKR